MSDNSPMHYDKIASLVNNAMLRTEHLKHYPFFKHIWKSFWEKSLRIFSGSTVLTSIHQNNVQVNYGYTYPFILRQHPTYNAPLIELVHLTFSEKKSKLSIIDIGAAVGDTMLCLLANCPNMVGDFACIDGDDKFFGYLKNNLQAFPNAKFIHAFLSSSLGEEKSLVKIHPGTASAQGGNMVPCTTLDHLLQKNQMEAVDVIKLDVDGFDGKILAGSVETLMSQKPAVFFEWHPLLCAQVQNSWSEHFEILTNCGYDRFLWFDNYGKFSHFMSGYDDKNVVLLANLLINKDISHLAYYDIVALHRESSTSPSLLATLQNAKRRLSWM